MIRKEYLVRTPTRKIVVIEKYEYAFWFPTLFNIADNFLQALGNVQLFNKYFRGCYQNFVKHLRDT